MTRSFGELPRIVILGAGLSGLTLANMLDPTRLDISVLAQNFPPGRAQQFHGIVTDVDLVAAGLDSGSIAKRQVRQVLYADTGKQRDVVGWWVVEHRDLLRALRNRAERRGIAVIDNQEEVELVWGRNIEGVRTRSGGQIFKADIVVFADESDPRVPESLGLRPDWLPTEIMHLAKVRFHGHAPAMDQILSITKNTSWGSPGYGLVVPGEKALSIKVAMLLEDEMATARHIREYLEEILIEPVVHDLLTGMERGEFVTEVVPIGGLDARHRFHRGRALVVSDLAGVTNPLNRDGFSTTLAVCRIAADTLHSASNARDPDRALARYSSALAGAFVAKVRSQRRRNRNLDAVPAWQWFSLPELVADSGVTSSPNDAKLFARRRDRLGDVAHRLRTLEYRRTPGDRD